MAKIYQPPRAKIDMFGRITIAAKHPTDFTHLLGMRVEDIVPFDNGTDELLEQGATILPRHYFIFIGTVDNQVQYKPYEFNQYRVVVSTTKGIITCIDSIG
jgi:hypothetical protein